MRQVEIGGRAVEISVRISKRVKGAKIVVDAYRNVEIVVSPRTSESAIESLLFEHRAWLERELAKPSKTYALGLQRDDVVWIGGLALARPQVASLEAWYREQARIEVTRALTRHSKRLNVGYESVTIRDQRSRWGSCSTRGALSFNWRLIVAPPAILEYVVVHELCHVLRHDHSPVFWQVVALVRPSFRDDRDWLAEHGHELLAYEVPRRLAA